MSKKSSQKKILIKDFQSIYDFISSISPSCAKYMDEHKDYEYLLFSKYITHSDIISKGKRNEKGGYEKNYLYYLTVEEMKARAELEEQNQMIEDLYGNDNNANIKTTSTAHQSCITVASEVYEFLDIPYVHKLKAKLGEAAPKQININDYTNVYLANDTLKYFNMDYTKKIFEKLGKDVPWNFDEYYFDLSDDDFTSINITEAAHGFGTQENIEFQILRMSLFLNDKFIVLESRKGDEKNLFIILDKNPRFYTVLGEINSNWEEYLNLQYNKSIFDATKTIQTKDGVKKTRKDQSKWRKLLAEEMMNFSANGSKIFCPISNMTIDFDKVGTLLRASHIKRFEDCETLEEAFDINNGLLISANADALFDKYLITIDEDGTIIYSFLIDKRLEMELNFNSTLFKYMLTPKRKEYLAEHKKRFEEEEIKRQSGNYQIDNFDEE